MTFTEAIPLAARALRLKHAPSTRIDYLIVSGFICQVVSDMMHFVDITDDGILRHHLVLVATFLNKTLALCVGPSKDGAALTKPLEQATIHNTHIFDAKVAERVGRSHGCCHASSCIIADDLVITVHAHVVHV